MDSSRYCMLVAGGLDAVGVDPLVELLSQDHSIELAIPPNFDAAVAAIKQRKPQLLMISASLISQSASIMESMAPNPVILLAKESEPVDLLALLRQGGL